jgi:hypothetical protein
MVEVMGRGTKDSVVLNGWSLLCSTLANIERTPLKVSDYVFSLVPTLSIYFLFQLITWEFTNFLEVIKLT